MELDVLKTIHESTAIIKQNQNLVGYGLLNIGNELKYVRDNKTYKQLGLNSFEEYCESNFKYSRQWAYGFIEIAETYNVNSSLQIAELGMKKLLSLAKLDESEREEFIANNDVQAMTTRDLETKIRAELKQKESEIENLKKCLELEEQRSETLSQSYDRLEAVNKEHYKKLKEKERELEIAKENYETGATNNRSRINTLSKELEALKAAEPKVVEKIVEKEVMPEDYNYYKDNFKRLSEASESKTEHINKLNNAINQKELELKDKNREVEALKADREEVDRMKESLEHLRRQKAGIMKDMEDYQKAYAFMKSAKEMFEKTLMTPMLLNLSEQSKENLKKDMSIIIETAENWAYSLRQKFSIGGK